MDKQDKTKYKLAHSIKTLMTVKTLDKITVKDIVTHCDVTRQTFYRHFLDKYDLVNWCFERLVEQSFEQMGVSCSLQEGLNRKFHFIEEEVVFFSGAFQSNDYNSLMNYDYEYIYKFYEAIITAKLQHPLDEELAFLLRMYCRGSIYMTVEWLNNKNRPKPEEVTALLVEALPDRKSVV